MRVVLDTNVLVSGLLKRYRGGIPDQILRRIRQYELYLSEAILQETERVLHYPRTQRKYHLPDSEIAGYLAYLRAIATMVEDLPQLAVVTKDPSDNVILACALKARAGYLVSGDPHLKDLQEYQGIKIVSPAAFLALLSP
jgi:putative PIN family toxin of toxin-antitoxin system